MTLIYLFLATFGVVFMLGFQSLSVQSGNYWLAAVNSVLIGVFNLTLLRTVPFIQETAAIAVYIVAGPIGILCSMLVHRKIVTPWRERKAERKVTGGDLDAAFWNWLPHACTQELADDIRYRWLASAAYRNAKKAR